MLSFFFFLQNDFSFCQLVYGGVVTDNSLEFPGGLLCLTALVHPACPWREGEEGGRQRQRKWWTYFHISVCLSARHDTVLSRVFMLTGSPLGPTSPSGPWGPFGPCHNKITVWKHTQRRIRVLWSIYANADGNGLSPLWWKMGQNSQNIENSCSVIFYTATQ